MAGARKNLSFPYVLFLTSFDNLKLKNIHKSLTVNGLRDYSGIKSGPKECAHGEPHRKAESWYKRVASEKSRQTDAARAGGFGGTPHPTGREACSTQKPSLIDEHLKKNTKFMSRNGKIARLPRAIRETLNLRLDDNEDGPETLEWLNGLPETRGVLDAHFGGVAISKQNLSQWRLGGYREWSLRRDLFEQARAVADCVDEMGESVETSLLPGNLAVVLAARYAKVLMTWDGEPDPKMSAEVATLRILCRDVALLQRTLQLADVQQQDRAQREEEKLPQEVPKVQGQAMAPALAATSHNSPDRLVGGSENGPETTALISALRHNMAKLKLEKLAGTGQSQSKPVKVVPRAEAEEHHQIESQC
jgi:hypothetical protein